MVYNANGYIGPAFYNNMNTFLSTHSTNTCLYYYIYDNLGNVYTGQFLTALISPYNVRIITGSTHTATATLTIQHHLTAGSILDSLL
jgi:hypothetical protein